MWDIVLVAVGCLVAVGIEAGLPGPQTPSLGLERHHHHHSHHVHVVSTQLERAPAYPDYEEPRRSSPKAAEGCMEPH
ncbi:hypothetical protein J6590_010184 [Homalodisca vitripennis]|nr:hypothetical protein J6590_010184 [Homalodisca vitripennis]